MKIFDYKFLILLALSLVVYFIYREVEYLRLKVNKLEKELKGTNINVLTDNLNQINLQTQPTIIPNNPILTLAKPPDSDNKNEITNLISNLSENMDNYNEIILVNKQSPKMISIDISPSRISEQNKFESEIKNIQKIHSESDSSYKSTISKHLAIYSNDNEQYNDTQNSLLESVESNKIVLNFDYDSKNRIPNINTNVNEIISMVTSENNSEKKNLNNSVSESIDSKGITIRDDKQTKLSDTFNEQDLEKKKLKEIKKIAESKKISLTKKINGQQKTKNKHELINEIINYKSVAINKADK
jgi:hypothetical protein